MYNNLRIDRRRLKMDAKLNFVKHRRPCFPYGIILMAAELLLSILVNTFLPWLTVEIPSSVLASPETLASWYETYVNTTLPGLLTTNNLLIALLLAVISIMVLVPLRFGGYEIAMKVNSGQESTLKDLLGWFTNGKRLLKSIAIFLIASVKTVLWGILFLAVPFGLLLGGALLMEQSFLLAETLIALSYVTAVGGAALTLGKFWSYTLSFFVFAEHEEAGVLASLREGKTLAKGRFWEIFVLYISFILWDLLNAMVFGVLDIYLVPYKNLTVSGFVLNVRAVNAGLDVYAPPADGDGTNP